MPTYDYECSSCGHRFEIFETIGAHPVKKCPECGRRKARRRMGTGAGIVFKGSGFYTTDYKRPSGAGGNEGGAKEPEKKKTARKEKKEEPKK